MKRLFDVFEEWLQGLINTCVSGLGDRITALEQAAPPSVLDEAIKNLTSKLDELSARLGVVEGLNGIDGKGKAALDRYLDEKLDDKLDRAFEKFSFTDAVRDDYDFHTMVRGSVLESEAFGESVKTVFDNMDMTDEIIESSTMERKLERMVEDAIDNYDFDDKVRDAVRNLTFSVEVE